MKRIRLLINNFHSTSFNYDARETEIIRGVEVIHLWKLSERTQRFSSPSCPKFYDIDINEITEFLFRKHDIFTTRGESSTDLFERADKNDVMVTRFSKMAVLLFTKGSFLYYEYQVWFSLKFRGKVYFVIIFDVKIKGSCPWAELPADVMCIQCSSESISALTRLV